MLCHQACQNRHLFTVEFGRGLLYPYLGHDLASGSILFEELLNKAFRDHKASC